MIKLLGGILIVMGPFVWGCMKSYRFMERMRRLNRISQSLLIFETQMDYALMSIPECFEKIGHSVSDAALQEFYLTMAEKLRASETASFDGVWKSGVEGCLKGESLTARDVELIGQVGEMPLYLNKQIQLTMLKNIRTQIQQQADQLKKECENKCKIYRITGLAVGTMCLLLLI